MCLTFRFAITCDISIAKDSCYFCDQINGGQPNISIIFVILPDKTEITYLSFILRNESLLPFFKKMIKDG